jgi:hypothetical protein
MSSPQKQNKKPNARQAKLAAALKKNMQRRKETNKSAQKKGMANATTI